ncbi:hypothetical protein RND81_08G192300 [Saponaria officinalis]|uniref:Uncharacterized protein n=1 Tax=Saponaria officinalis TaxID=3572 RepID=A0AAW1J9R1_SAPOF
MDDDHAKRSSSSSNGMQLDLYRGNNYDRRSYSLNSSYFQNHNNNNIYDNNQIAYEFDYKLKRSKTTCGFTQKMSFLDDPEFKRKKRVASYRALTVEGKVKGSFRKSFKRLKNLFIHGWMVVTN